MPSQTKENYLKAIFYLAEGGKKIALSDLSRDMGVSNPTANSMVKKLKKAGWIVYEKYKPIELTKLGRKIAALIIRKHRLTEMFLVEKMGFGWEEVHDIAEEMEHIDSEKLFDRMDELLGFPAIDPHGSPIPDKNGRIVANDYLKLSDASEGDRVQLRALNNSSNDLLRYLNKKQLELGTEIKVLHIEPYDKSMTITYGEQTDSVLTREVCDHLLVEVVN